MSKLSEFGKEHGWLATIIGVAFSLGMFKMGYDRDMTELKTAMLETRDLRKARWPVVEKLVREVDQLYFEVDRIETELDMEHAHPVSSSAPIHEPDIVLPTLWRDDRMWKVVVG